MNSDPCQQQRDEVEAALKEYERILEGSEPDPDPVGRATPVMGGDLGSRFYENIGRHEAARRRYRTAVRSLSECLRQQATGSGD
ncbi:MAG: hypothetical protein R3191_07090 [Anaerolineales bacterium]|nr:hypothetical protein [Anaerolineales bacterium]